MEIDVQLINIIEDGSYLELINFLKKLTIIQKNLLGSTIEEIYYEQINIVMKSLTKYTNGYLFWESEEGKLMTFKKTKLTLSKFICVPNGFLDPTICPIINEYGIFEWYFPEWLYKGYNEHMHLNYYGVHLKCIEDNLRIPTEIEIAQALVKFTLEGTENIPKITLEKHIWYLFQYQTDIYIYDKWLEQFKKYILNHDIDRFRVLQESLLTSTRGFNRPLSSWFYKLFDFLEPTKPELLKLQDELFVSLSSPQSKCVTQTLKYIKQIHKEKDFNLTEFSSHIPTLLSWNIKTVVNNTLSLIDVLIKAYPKERENLALLSLEVLASEDESIQIKLLKILNKHKLLDNQTILEEIKLYAEGLYSASKEILPNMEETEIEENFEIIPPQFIREDNKIPTYETFDELVFFFSQVFEGKNAYDFDLFVAYLPKLHKMINEDNISKLELAFVMAYKFYKSSRNIDRTISQIKLLMSLAFLEYAIKLNSKFPDKLEHIEKLYDDMVTYEIEIEEKYHWHKSKLIDFENINLKSPSIFTIYHLFLSNMLSQITHGYSFQLLSTPTHTPSWIDANTLISRLKWYQNNEIKIDAYDMQIALSRVIINHSDITYIKKELSGEIREILLYLWENKKLDITQIKSPEYWFSALLRKKDSLNLELFANTFSKENIANPLMTPISFEVSRKLWENRGERWWTSKLITHKTNELYKLSFNSIYKHTRIDKKENYISGYDAKNLICLSPAIPYYLFDTLMDLSIEEKHYEYALLALIEIWNDFDSSVYLYLATNFLGGDIIRTLSSELWIKATIEGTMNHQLLGQTLGKLEHNEYAPLKRFTDLIVANMLNISSLHNRGLEVLLSSMINQMNDEPIKGTKKLLEIYLEVLSLTKQNPSEEVLEKLSIWGEVKSLKVIVKKIGRV